MKVQYWKSSNIFTAFNASFKLILNIHVQKKDHELSILYDPWDIVQFLNDSFLPVLGKASFDFTQMMQVLLYPGCKYVVEQKVYVNVYGLKYFFSSLVSFTVSQYENFDALGIQHSKFIGWVMKFDFDQVILKGHEMVPETAVTCNFCKFLPSEFEGASSIGSRTEYLLCLAKVAGQEFREVIEKDNKDSQRVSQSAPLASYNPVDDWESSSLVSKHSLMNCYLRRTLSYSKLRSEMPYCWETIQKSLVANLKVATMYLP